jgi:hypothetical protein
VPAIETDPLTSSELQETEEADRREGQNDHEDDQRSMSLPGRAGRLQIMPLRSNQRTHPKFAGRPQSSARVTATTTLSR